jgi:hypothetical protein
MTQQVILSLFRLIFEKYKFAYFLLDGAGENKILVFSSPISDFVMKN